MPQVEEAERVTVEAEPSARAELESNVSAKMADIFKDGDDEVVVTEAKPSEEAETAPAESETEEKPETEEKALEKKKTDSEPAAKPTAPAAPSTTLPAAYLRSLKAYQWTDEEIAAGQSANPEGFVKMAERIHQQRVQQTQQWADLGKRAKAQEQAKPAAETPKLTAVDIKALRSKYGNEPFIDQLEAMHKALEYTLPFIEQSQQRQQAAEMESLNRYVEGFFGDKQMEPYHDHYGKSGQTLTDAQTQARQKVLETADLLISGARSTGRPMTLDEALTMAHDSVSTPIAAKAAVAKVQKQVQQRQASISVRPGSRAASSSKEDTRKNLETNVRKGLASVFK